MKWSWAALLLCACTPSHPTESALSKGPWTERIADTSATVRWESTTQGMVELALSVEGSTVEEIHQGQSVETHVVGDWPYNVKQPDLPGTYYRNEIDLGGLQPSTCYTYRMRSPKGDQKGRFCTARASGTPFTFMAIGDTNPILGHTVPTLNHVLPANPDFVVHLGDMQYYSSAAETWAYWFDVMAPMLRAGAILPTVGNHENEADGTEYDDYYGRLFVPAGPDADEQLYYHYETGGVHFFSLNTEEPLAIDSPQTAWIKQALADAQASDGFRFSIVYMHRPFYTLGDAAPQLDGRKLLEPFFQTLGVKLVLAGHMHGYERFLPPSGITYVTCAGGGGVINDVNAGVGTYPDDAPYRQVVSDHYHACLYSISDGQLSSTVIDEFGSTIDQFTLTVP